LQGEVVPCGKVPAYVRQIKPQIDKNQETNSQKTL
jgi:hypothetical protein